MTPDEAVVARLARIETEIATMREENRALRTTLHEMIGRALGEHSAAISRLAAAHDQRTGIWWTLLWAGGGVIILSGAVAWLLENRVQIIVKP